MTREQWLENAVRYLKDNAFKRHGHAVPNVRVSVGFPGGGGDKRRVLGEHWHPKASEDKRSQIFITPTIQEPVKVLSVLAHELVHAIVPEAGHRAAFRRIAVSIGLEGKMTETVPGQALTKEFLDATDKILGPYPHAAIQLGDRKKQTTRLLKVSCLACEYTCRVTQKWLDALGAPICPGCHETMAIETKDFV